MRAKSTAVIWDRISLAFPTMNSATLDTPNVFMVTMAFKRAFESERMQIRRPPVLRAATASAMVERLAHAVTCTRSFASIPPANAARNSVLWCSASPEVCFLLISNFPCKNNKHVPLDHGNEKNEITKTNKLYKTKQKSTITNSNTRPDSAKLPRNQM